MLCLSDEKSFLGHSHGVGANFLIYVFRETTLLVQFTQVVTWSGRQNLFYFKQAVSMTSFVITCMKLNPFS